MKIALLDSWPNLEESAELEFIKRFIIAAEHLGDVEARRVVTSDDIYEFSPDAVLSSHEFSRKLTKFPTIGLLWSPLSFFVEDEYRRTSVQSYDGYVVGNEILRHFVEDINFSRSIRKPVGTGLFLPTSYITDINSLECVETPSLCYLGVHWDGGRHGRVFDALTQRDLITLYGPRSSWQSYPNHYGGMVPFDGMSVQKVIASHGVALCLHKKEHRQQNTPSMRIFEALSVGALPICDQIEFARTELSEVVLFVDTTKSPKAIAQQIADHLVWIKENKDEALERVRKGKKWFENEWSLEHKIGSVIIPTIRSVLEEGLFPGSVAGRPTKSNSSGKSRHIPECEIVVRAGGRSLNYLRRAVASVVAADSVKFALGLIVVDYKSRNDIREFVLNEVAQLLPARYLVSIDNGFRSTALWVGLRAVKAPYVAHLDDDDTIHPNHYRQLAKTLMSYPSSPLAYSGVIKKEDDEGRYFSAINFKGPADKEITENRELYFMSDYDLTRLAQFDNYIQSNTWMARTEILQSVIGEDPCLEVIEDVYLYLLMAQRGSFAFTSSPTAVWHWRSSQADNSMTSVGLAKWMRDGQRVARRLENLHFHYIADLRSLKILKPERVSTIQVGENFNAEAELEPLTYDTAVDGGSALSERVAFKGFHPAEASGIWSRETKAHMVLKLDSEVQMHGGAILIEFIASDTSVGERFAEFSLDQGERRKIEAVGWDVKQVILPVAPGTSETCKIFVGIDSLFIPASNGGDNRKLGVHIKSICILSTIGELESVDRPQLVSLEREEVGTPAVEELAQIKGGSSVVNASLTAQMKVLENPIISFFRKGNYSHVGVSEYREDVKLNICKLQANSDNYSMQFDLVNFEIGEEIGSKYIELDNGPVFRIYFNGNERDINNRIRALPKRLRDVIYDIAVMRYNDFVSDSSRDSVNEMVTIFKRIQQELEWVKIQHLLSAPDIAA